MFLALLQSLLGDFSKIVLRLLALLKGLFGDFSKDFLKFFGLT